MIRAERGGSAESAFSHFGVGVEEVHCLVVHLQQHLLRPHLPFSIQQAQLPDAVVDGEHGVLTVHDEGGQVLQDVFIQDGLPIKQNKNNHLRSGSRGARCCTSYLDDVLRCVSHAVVQAVFTVAFSLL